MRILKGPTISYLLVAVMVVAAILRFKHINQPLIDAFSWRQSSTAMMADNFYRTNWNIFYPEVSWGGAGPSYQGREFQTVSYISALLYTIVGQHDWVGRSVAAVFGLWGIFALYQLVRRVWDEEHALVSAAVMALLPGSIFIERSFLPDPAMVALVTTSLWLLVVYLQTDRWHYLLLAGAIGTWGFLSKIPGLIVGIPMIYAMLTILAAKKMLYLRKVTQISLAGILMLIPVVAYYLWARHLATSYPPYHFAGAGNWLWDWGLARWLKESYFLPQLKYWLDDSLWTTPVTILILFGLFVPPPQYKSPYDFTVKAPWLFHWWLVACIIYYVIGAKELVGNPWNFHIFNPPAAALAGRGIVALASSWTSVLRSPVSLTIIAVFLLSIGGFSKKTLSKMYSPHDSQSHQLGIALRQVTQPGDLVVTVANSIGNPIAIYYSQRRGWTFPPAKNGTDWGKLPDDDNNAIKMFEELRYEGANWFGIVGSRKKELWENNPKFIKHIECTCELQQESPEWVIYRILAPEEVAKLSA